MKRAMSDGYKECACDKRVSWSKRKDCRVMQLKYAVTTFTFQKIKWAMRLGRNYFFPSSYSRLLVAGRIWLFGLSYFRFSRAFFRPDCSENCYSLFRAVGCVRTLVLSV